MNSLRSRVRNGPAVNVKVRSYVYDPIATGTLWLGTIDIKRIIKAHLDQWYPWHHSSIWSTRDI